eukprot:scaffold1184_cov132-Cylindrotheca_fusiformis.AAC.50
MRIGIHCQHTPYAWLARIMRLDAFLLLTSAGLAAGLNAVVYGPQERIMLLLTAKLAAKEMETSLICESGAESLCRRFMYGVDYEKKGIDEEGRAKPISKPEDMEAALKTAGVLFFVSHENPVDQKAATTLIDTAGEGLSKVVLLSKMGVTKETGGFFGGSKNKLLQSEKMIRDICDSKHLDLSIVRAGNLKGGGCGRPGNDYGLNEVYYNTLVDVVEASVCMAHDKYTVGADCTLGDSIEMPNMFTQLGTKSSFDPCPSDSNRIAVASGAVAAALKDDEIEFSVSAAKAEQPPSSQEWTEILENLSYPVQRIIRFSMAAVSRVGALSWQCILKTSSLRSVELVHAISEPRQISEHVVIRDDMSG